MGGKKNDFDNGIEAILETSVPDVYVETLGAPGRGSPRELLTQAIGRRPRFNNFNGKRVAEWLTRNADEIWAIRFGREYSPVLYVTPTRDHAKGPSHLALFNSAKRELEADEVDIENSSTGEIRLWWD